MYKLIASLKKLIKLHSIFYCNFSCCTNLLTFIFDWIRMDPLFMIFNEINDRASYIFISFIHYCLLYNSYPVIVSLFAKLFMINGESLWRVNYKNVFIVSKVVLGICMFCSLGRFSFRAEIYILCKTKIWVI